MFEPIFSHLRTQCLHDLMFSPSLLFGRCLPYEFSNLLHL